MLDRSFYVEFARALETGVPVTGESKSQTGDFEKLEPVNIKFRSLPDKEKSSIGWYDFLVSKISLMKQEGIVTNAIVHGSYGDFTNTRFSDLELTLILSNDVVSDEGKKSVLRNWLKQELNPALLKIDPLQHHGAFYLLPAMVSAYDEAILPLCAYESSWAFFPESMVFYPCREKHREKNVAFVHTLSALGDYEERFFVQGYNPYTIKRLISNVLLLPAFFYQKSGIYRSKKESICEIRALGNKAINDMLDICTELRRNWPKPPAWLGILRGFITQARIPSGRYHSGICALYKNRRVEKEVTTSLIPLLENYCKAFGSLKNGL